MEQPAGVVQFVIKVSKFCNLRCSYCYEFDELGDPRRMSLTQIEYMFAHIAAYYRAVAPRAQIRMIWHGGEPLVQDVDYYRAIFGLQEKHFEGLNVSNLLQTNLTLLDEDRIELLRKFDSVGVSIDLFGEHRLNIAGKSSQARVLHNMRRLNEAKIDYGCITVLTSRNIDQLDRIFRFYEEMGLFARVLPLFNADQAQNENHSLNAEMVTAALCRVVDLTLASERSRGIAPVHELINDVVSYKLSTREYSVYDRGAWESLIIVNTDGLLYAQADAYTEGRSWGNIFHHPLGQLIGSVQHQQSVERTNHRIARGGCLDCGHLRTHCSGFPIGEDHRGYSDAMHNGRPICVVERRVLDHIVMRLDQYEAERPGTWERIRARMNSEASNVVQLQEAI